MRAGRLTGLAIAGAISLCIAGFLTWPSPAYGRTELVDQRTSHSKTFKNEDGTFTLELSGQPLHYQNESGEWLDIDVRLQDEPAGEFAYSAKKNRPKVWLPRKAHQRARFEVGKHYLHFQPLNVSDAEVVKRDETTVVFAQAWQNTDLSYQVIPEGLKENIIINGRPSPHLFTFQLEYPGASPQLQDGSIVFLNAETGEELWRFPRPYAVELHEGAAPSYEAVRYELRTDGHNRFVDLVVDPAWLNDPARQFPVLVDPTIVSLGPGAEQRSITSYVSQTMSYWWRMEAPACWGTDTKTRVRIGTSPGAGNILNESIDNTLSWSSVSEEGSGSFSASADQTFYLQTIPGHYWWLFGGGPGRAYLRVTYISTHPPQTSAHSPGGNQWLASSTPTFQWTYSDQDNQTMVSYRLQVARNQAFTQELRDTGAVPSDKPPGSTVTVQLGQALSDGAWYWRVQVYDGELWSDWSTPSSFRIDTTPPSAGSVAWALLPYPRHGTVITWDPFSDAGSGVKSYTVQYDLNQGSGYQFLVERDLNTRTAEVDANKAPGLPYNWPVDYRIIGIDHAGNQSAAVVQTATEAGWTTIDPAATLVTADGTGGYQASLAIIPTAASAYQVMRSDAAGNVVLGDWVTSPQYLDPGPLKPHETYVYAVRARNFLGVGHDLFGDPRSITVPNSLPSPVALLEPADGAALNSPTIMLQGEETFDPDGDELQYQIQWRSTLNTTWSETTWSSSPAAEVVVGAEGTYEWRVLVKDGYMGQTPPVESAVRRFLIDTTPPAVSLRVDGDAPGSVGPVLPGQGVGRLARAVEFQRGDLGCYSGQDYG